MKDNLLDVTLFGSDSGTPLKEPMLPNLPYSPEQLFWISFGQNHCLKMTQEMLDFYGAQKSHHPFPKYRVNSIAANSPFFSRDFKCPVGSEMNPEEKCKVWGFQGEASY